MRHPSSDRFVLSKVCVCVRACVCASVRVCARASLYCLVSQYKICIWFSFFVFGHSLKLIPPPPTPLPLLHPSPSYTPPPPTSLPFPQGHACPGLYGVLVEAGVIPEEHLKTLRRVDSDLEGHPTPVSLSRVHADVNAVNSCSRLFADFSLSIRSVSVKTTLMWPQGLLDRA